MALKIKTISIGLLAKIKPIKFSKTSTNMALKKNDQRIEKNHFSHPNS